VEGRNVREETKRARRRVKCCDRATAIAALFMHLLALQLHRWPAVNCVRHTDALLQIESKSFGSANLGTVGTVAMGARMRAAKTLANC
jgi:hypothetical protein